MKHIMCCHGDSLRAALLAVTPSPLSHTLWTGGVAGPVSCQGKFLVVHSGPTVPLAAFLGPYLGSGPPWACVGQERPPAVALAPSAHPAPVAVLRWSAADLLSPARGPASPAAGSAVAPRAGRGSDLVPGWLPWSHCPTPRHRTGPQALSRLEIPLMKGKVLPTSPCPFAPAGPGAGTVPAPSGSAGSVAAPPPGSAGPQPLPDCPVAPHAPGPGCPAAVAGPAVWLAETR